MTKRQRTILFVRLAVVVAVAIAYTVLAFLDFHQTVVAPIAVILIAAALFVPIPGSKATATVTTQVRGERP